MDVEKAARLSKEVEAAVAAAAATVVLLDPEAGMVVKAAVPSFCLERPSRCAAEVADCGPATGRPLSEPAAGSLG